MNSVWRKKSRLPKETDRDQGVGSVLFLFFFFFLAMSVAFCTDVVFSAFFSTAAGGGDADRCMVVLGDVATD